MRNGVTKTERIQSHNLFGQAEVIGKGVKIEVSRNLLCAELDLLAGIVEAKAVLPGYSYLLVEALNNRLILKASGLNNTLQCEIEAEVLEEGSICLPARKLHEICRHLPSETISISSDESAATLRWGGSRFKLNSIPTDEFPESPSGGKFIAVIPGEILLTMIRSTIFAVSRDRDSGRYALDGARLCIGPGGIQMVATNGHRLSCFERTDVTSDEDFTLLIPRTSLNAITKVFAASDQEISAGFDANRLFFTQGTRRLSCQTVDGQFPDCGPIISQEYQHQLTLDVGTFKDVLNRMAVFGVDNSHQHFGVIKFHISPDTYEMLSVDSQGGEGLEETPALSIGADQEITISFKGHYLEDFARTLPDSSLVIKFNDEISPVEFSPAGDDLFASRYILMPCRL